jgi:glutaminase
MESEAHRFGIAFTHIDGTHWHHGDSEHAFPLHSISKVFTYALALEDNGREKTLEHVGVEPSGTRSIRSPSTRRTTALSIP